MRLLKITNQPKHKRYGEIVLLDDNGHCVCDVVYDGKGHHNYPSRVDGDYRMAKSELATYGYKALRDYLESLRQCYGLVVK